MLPSSCGLPLCSGMNCSKNRVELTNWRIRCKRAAGWWYLTFTFAIDNTGTAAAGQRVSFLQRVHVAQVQRFAQECVVLRCPTALPPSPKPSTSIVHPE